MTDLEEKIREYGLTPEQYESCLSDAYQKANHTLDMDWSEIIDKYGLDIHFDTLRKATQTIFGGAFVSEYFKSKKASTMMIHTWQNYVPRNTKSARKNKSCLMSEPLSQNF